MIADKLLINWYKWNNKHRIRKMRREWDKEDNYQ